MAILTAKGISSVALELLTRNLVLVPTVTLVPGSEFMGPNGGTITVRVPQPSSSREQGAGGGALTADDVSEIPVDVALSHEYHLKNITDQELSYSLEDFALQITRPQVNAVATGAEDKLAAVMNALASPGAGNFEFDITPATGTQDDETKRVLLNARKALSDAKAPLSDRYLAVSSSVANRLIHMLTPISGGGLDAAYASQALQEAIIGRILGFTVVESVGLTDGTAVAYHKSGFVFANRAPAQPRGATSSSVSTKGPFSLRQVFQYDAGHAQDQSLISTFAGAAAVYEDGTGSNGTVAKRFVKIDTSAT
jgi:hypothetical protein